MVAEGNVLRERETNLLDPKGEQANCVVRSLAVSGMRIRLSRIVISLVDLTKRKRPKGPPRQRAAIPWIWPSATV